MLSLVAYGNSDDSESDEEQPKNLDDSPKNVPLRDDHKKANDEETTSSLKSGNDRTTQIITKETGKLTSLPSSQMTSINFDLKILDKKRSQPIRITIPSLKELETDDEPERKPKLKPSAKGSGLFSLLPEPKNVTSVTSKALVPQAVANATKPKQEKLKPQKIKIKQKTKTFDDDFDNEDDEGKPLNSFFFSSHDDVPLPPVDLHLDMPMPSGPITPSTEDPDVDITRTVGVNLQPQSVFPATSENPSIDTYQAQPNEIAEPSLDSAALLKLCGSRDRRKAPDLSEIIDVNGSSLVGDTTSQLVKELSKEQPTHSFKRKSECSSLQRRKHQITYLAEQAKAQELELRNNWAQNRMTRKQTQAKYGF